MPFFMNIFEFLVFFCFRYNQYFVLTIYYGYVL